MHANGTTNGRNLADRVLTLAKRLAETAELIELTVEEDSVPPARLLGLAEALADLTLRADEALARAEGPDERPRVREYVPNRPHDREAEILAVLKSQGPVTASRVAKTLRLNHYTTQRVLLEMEKRGAASRTPGPAANDARHRQVDLWKAV